MRYHVFIPNAGRYTRPLDSSERLTLCWVRVRHSLELRADVLSESRYDEISRTIARLWSRINRQSGGWRSMSDELGRIERYYHDGNIRGDNYYIPSPRCDENGVRLVECGGRSHYE